ncbi:hypothetical protein QNN95_16055 (plasmid) [Exiguobacterium acetylicum]|uniref:AbiTii domain-containing protein n=1 Tax=Exiguobacterium acetylicum TaxID=41170 RepID=UPI0035A5F2C4
MESIVLELQREIINKSTNAVDLLRKAMLVAQKLQVKEFEEWVHFELNGFIDLSSVPNYREVVGQVEMFDSITGWNTIIFEDERIVNLANRQKLGLRMSEIQSLLSGKSSLFSINMVPALNQLLSKVVGEVTEYRLSIPRHQIEKIQDSVKNIILDWTIKLERDGIMGEGFSFSEEEKKEATKHNYNVNNFFGNAADIQIQQNVEHSTQTMNNTADMTKISEFVSQLQENLTKTELSIIQQKDIEAEIEEIKKEIKNPNPLVSKLKKSFISIKATLEGAGGNLIASGLIHMIDKLPL